MRPTRWGLKRPTRVFASATSSPSQLSDERDLARTQLEDLKMAILENDLPSPHHRASLAPFPYSSRRKTPFSFRRPRSAGNASLRGT